MTPTVSLICLADRPDHLRVFLAALRVQTEQAWELFVLDQQEDERALASLVAPLWVERGAEHVKLLRVPRHGDWGQTEKIAAVSQASGDFVGFPNDDAYYCPVYLEHMLAMAKATDADLVYCDWVSASDFGRHTYTPFEAAPVTGYIDVGGFLIRREAILKHGWPDRGPTGDGHLIESLVKQGVRHVRVPRTLYVKN